MMYRTLFPSSAWKENQISKKKKKSQYNVFFFLLFLLLFSYFLVCHSAARLLGRMRGAHKGRQT